MVLVQDYCRVGGLAPNDFVEDLLDSFLVRVTSEANVQNLEYSLAALNIEVWLLI